MIWLVGKNGMLGTDLGRAFDAAGLGWVGTDREVDFTDASALDAFAEGRTIDWVVNCAAYTAVDKAEDEPDLCRRLNVDGPANLARWCTAHGAALVHISTDYVFSGTGTDAYRESDPVGPTGIYGITKADGEDAVRGSCARHYILRTAWLYGAWGPNFAYTMLRLMNLKDALGVVADQWGAPTWTVDLARVVVELIRRGEGPWGTYHASGEGRCSWHQFAEAILVEGKARGFVPATKAVAVNALTTDQYPTKARRPAWSVLSKEKLATTVGLRFPGWEVSLRAFLDSPLDQTRFRP
jgi:dTDP-4-dehydrorhamnose reductase